MSRFKSRFQRKFDKGEFKDKFAIDDDSGAWVSKCDYINPDSGAERYGGRDDEMAPDANVHFRFSELNSGGCVTEQREYERMVGSCKTIKIVNECYNCGHVNSEHEYCDSCATFLAF